MSTTTVGTGTTTVIQPADAIVPCRSTSLTQPTPGTSYTITAAATAPGIEAGEQFQDFGLLAKLLSTKFEALGRGMSEPSQMMLASARPEDWSNAYANITRSGIASLGFTREHDFVMQHQHDWQVIERACNEARLPGGSLTAAPGTPGWCAPCTVNYDFCPPAVLDGLVDLPTVIATRGCLTFPTMPDFGLLYSGTGFCYPAADYDNAPNPNPVVPGPKNKPCMSVPCPEQQTCNLDPCGVCLQSSILVEKAYPELVEYFIANALVAWGHRMNCRDLTQMIAASTRVPSYGAGSLGPQPGPGAGASILEAIEYYATWLRYKYRLGLNVSVEAVLPEWVKGVVRADLSKRRGIELMAVTDEMVTTWLALRKVRVQWVLGLDEAFCDEAPAPSQMDPKLSLKFGGNAPALGDSAGGVQVPPTMWPKTVSFLLYPAGTFFRARMNLINIESGLVDSALLKRNERLLLFVEEASVVCKRCYESLYITLDICASGQTGGPSATQPACLGPTPPPPPPRPAVSVSEDGTDPNHMTAVVLVDNHGRGPVAIDWGQTPVLPPSTNPGDGTSPTSQTYTEGSGTGTWTITATDQSDPTNITTTAVTIPFSGAPALTLTAVDTAPPSRTWQASWDNHGQGEVELFWGDEAGDPPVGVTKPSSGTDTHTYADTVPASVTVRVWDKTTTTRTASQAITLPPVPPPAPMVTIAEAADDPNKMTVLATVDNHGRGPVTIDWGQTPALPASSNPGDGTTQTRQTYTENSGTGNWTITVTDDSEPTNTATASAHVPFAGAPDMTMSAEDTNPPSRTWRVTWDNHGQGDIELFWGDEIGIPPVGVTKPSSGTETHTYAVTLPVNVTVRVRDKTLSAREVIRDITLPIIG